MDSKLDSLADQVGSRRNFDTPPVHLWNPPLSGDIPIRIDLQGNWFHDGGKIERTALVNLFASILRRENDGEYYLVTPAEKWRIEVEKHPLMVVDIEREMSGTRLEATLNTGKTVFLEEQGDLFLEPSLENVAVLRLANGLTGLFTRSAWYRLVEMAEEIDGIASVKSAGNVYPLVQV